MLTEFTEERFKQLTLEEMRQEIKFAKSELKEVIEEFRQTEPMLKKAVDKQAENRNERSKVYIEQLNDIEKERALVRKEGKLTDELNEHYDDMEIQLETMLRPINEVFERWQKDYDDATTGYKNEIQSLEDSIKKMKEFYLKKIKSDQSIYDSQSKLTEQKIQVKPQHEPDHERIALTEKLKQTTALLKANKRYGNQPTTSEMQDAIDKTRKKNGKINYTQAALKLGVTDNTMRSWCKKFNIQ